MDRDNLDTFNNEPSPNVTEEEKSELMPEKFIHSVKNLLAGNQDQVLRTQSSAS